MIEKNVEQRLIDKVELLGGKAYKFVSPGTTGMPDRIVILPEGKIYFVECKRPKGGVLSERQRIMHIKLRSLGCDVRLLYTYKLIDEFIEELKRG